MIITINTKEDSHDDIQKVIKMLQHLVGEHPVSNRPDLFGDSSETETTIGENNLMGMFDSGPTASTDTPTTDASTSTGTATETTSEVSEEKKDDDIPEVIPY